MRKEVIFAIIIGLTLGLVILYGIRIANQSTKLAASTSVTPAAQETGSPTIAVENDSGLTIISPKNHAVVNTDTIRIVGKTVAGATIAISDSEDDLLVTADNNGNFTADLELIGGGNVIRFTVLKPDLTTISREITVIYTTAKID